MEKSTKIVVLSIIFCACILLGYGIFGKTVNDTTQENAELNTSRNYLIEQIGNLQADYDVLSESYKVLYNNSDTKTKEIITLSNQIESLKKDLSASQAKVDSLENETATLQNQVAQLTSDVNAKSLQIAELETQLETAKENAEYNAETIASLETQIESLNNELAKTKQDLETATLELDTTKSELETANSNLSAKTSELETLQAKYDEQTKSLTEAQQTIVTLNATIVEKDNKINELVAQLNSDSDLFKKLMSGEITEVKATDFPSGITEIRPYQFYNCTNLISVELPTTITSIGNYAFSGCSSLSCEFIFNDLTIGEFAFCNTNITAIRGSVKDIGTSAFHYIGGLNLFDLKINGSLGRSAISGWSNVQSFYLDPDSVITDINAGNFYQIGQERMDDNIFTLDLRNSTFTSIGSSSFVDLKYTDIYLPCISGVIKCYDSFSFLQNVNIYYSNVLEINAESLPFGSSESLKNFFPYDLLKTASISDVWMDSSVLATIYGYAPANTFDAGYTLPENDSQGNSLVWYSDSSMTKRVINVSDKNSIYYCKLGESVTVTVTGIKSYQATCTVTDSAGKLYSEGDTIKFGTILTITAIGDEGFNQIYKFTLNDNPITSGTTYKVDVDDISIICVYYNGTNFPCEFNFADNTPAQIKLGIDSGVAKVFWNVGDKKEVTLTDGQTVNIVLLDLQSNRYEKSDGIGYSNGVLGIEQCVMKASMNSSATNVGGWAESEMYKTTMATCLALLPIEWQEIISKVKIASTIGSKSTAISYSDNDVFLPAYSEVRAVTTTAGYKDEGSIFDYYASESHTSVKYYEGSAIGWWLRSPSLKYSKHYLYINSSGSVVNSFLTATVNAYSLLGVSICFAI